MLLSPQMASRIVVLPSPVLPIRTAYCPWGTSKEMPTRRKGPERMVMLASSTIGHSALRTLHSALLALQVRHHQRYISRRDTANTTGLSERHRSHPAKLFSSLEP